MSVETSVLKVNKTNLTNILVTLCSDVRKIGAQGDQDVRKIGAQGDDNRKTLEKQDELGAKKANRQQARARSLARAF